MFSFIYFDLFSWIFYTSWGINVGEDVSWLNVEDFFIGESSFLLRFLCFSGEMMSLSKLANGSFSYSFFFFSLPLALIACLLFYLLFRVFFHYRISKFIRKYSFSGVLLIIVCEGKVEKFAFYFFSECRNLFSVIDKSVSPTVFDDRRENCTECINLFF